MHDVHLEVAHNELPDHDGEAAERAADGGVASDESRERDAVPHRDGGGVEGDEGDEEDEGAHDAVHARVALHAAERVTITSDEGDKEDEGAHDAVHARVAL